MQRASKLFQPEQLQAIERAVRDAESQTSCELVPVVATSSGRYDRPEDIVGVWMSVIAACAVWLMLPRDLHESGCWDGMPLWVGLFTMVVCVVLAFLIGTLAGSRIAPLRRLFTPRAVVFADQSILEKLGQPFLDRLCQQLTADLHRGNAADALSSVIREAGAQLSGPFPRTASDVNELHDALILID